MYLLDDPLSAVDEHVGRHLIDHVIGPLGLLKSKCKILATNSIGVLSIANNIHMVSNGKIVEHGTYDEIMKQESSLLRQLIKDFGKRKEELSNEEELNSENEDKINLENLESDSDFEIDSLRRASDASLIPGMNERDVEEERGR